MRSTRVSVLVKSFVSPFIMSLRVSASNDIDPKVNIPVGKLSGKAFRGLTDLKKANPTNAKNNKAPKKYSFFPVVIPVGLNLMLIM
jgi:hypothetical protein